MSTASELKRIENALVKLRNKMKRADLDYTVQISISSVDPGAVRYAGQITSPAEGLAPVTFINNTADELVDAIKASTKHIDYEKIEIAFHEAQIKACQRTIVGHQERIEEIKNPLDAQTEETSTDDKQTNKKEVKPTKKGKKKNEKAK